MKKYQVNDSETGNAVIYDGFSKKDAIEAIKNSHNEDKKSGEETFALDLYQDGERIYCDLINCEDELNKI